MPVLKPFKALHANEKHIKHFPSKSIDKYTEEEIQEKLNSIYHSIIQVVAPSFENDDQDLQTRYQQVRENFLGAIQEEVLTYDSLNGIYVYQQVSEDVNITGVIGLFDLKDVENGKIKVHENTLKTRREKFADYLNEVHIQSEPVLFTYPTNSKIELLLSKAKQSRKLFTYTDESGVEHNVWRIENRTNLSNFVSTFKNMEAIYVADGHHRLASSQIYRENQMAQDSDVLGNEPYQYILGYAVGNDLLKIYDYNRLVTDLNGLSTEEFLEKLSENFTVVEKGDEVYFPSQKYHLSMYLDGKFYGLYINHELRGVPEGEGELDTFLFEKYICKSLLDIENSSTDKRIDFLKGTADKNGISNLKDAVDSGDYKVAFGFHPVKFNDIKKISDLNKIMPPKSTFILPKMNTGLLMYNMKAD